MEPLEQYEIVKREGIQVEILDACTSPPSGKTHADLTDQDHVGTGKNEHHPPECSRIGEVLHSPVPFADAGHFVDQEEKTLPFRSAIQESAQDRHERVVVIYELPGNIDDVEWVDSARLGEKSGAGRNSMNGDRYFLDTNILVCANDRSDPRRQSIAVKLVADGIRRRCAVVSPQVLGEFLVTVTRKVETPLTLEAAEAEVARFKSITLVSIEYSTVILAMHLQRMHGIAYWDALILAAARTADCKTLYSEDLNDGQSYGEVTVRNPFS
jgi:predicted nucleic acid-binding protein